MGRPKKIENIDNKVNLNEDIIKKKGRKKKNEISEVIEENVNEEKVNEEKVVEEKVVEEKVVEEKVNEEKVVEEKVKKTTKRINKNNKTKEEKKQEDPNTKKNNIEDMINSFNDINYDNFINNNEEIDNPLLLNNSSVLSDSKINNLISSFSVEKKIIKEDDISYTHLSGQNTNKDENYSIKDNINYLENNLKTLKFEENKSTQKKKLIENKNIEDSIKELNDKIKDEKNYYIYLKYNFKKMDKTTTEEYLLRYIHFINMNVYPRNDDIDCSTLLITEEDRKDLEYEDEYNIELKEIKNIKIKIRIIKNKIDNNEIKDDKWHMFFMQFKYENVDMTDKDIFNKVLIRDSWNYYLKNENIYLVMERTHKIDNSYVLNKKFRFIIEEEDSLELKKINYTLNLTLRDVIMKIIENK